MSVNSKSGVSKVKFRVEIILILLFILSIIYNQDYIILAIVMVLSLIDIVFLRLIQNYFILNNIIKYYDINNSIITKIINFISLVSQLYLLFLIISHLLKTLVITLVVSIIIVLSLLVGIWYYFKKYKSTI